VTTRSPNEEMMIHISTHLKPCGYLDVDVSCVQDKERGLWIAFD